MADRLITASTLPAIKAIANIGSLTAKRVLYTSSTTVIGQAVLTDFARINVLSAALASDLLAAIDTDLATLAGEDGGAGYVKGGSWTPVLTFATPGDLARTYTTQFGDYVKIGGLVIATFNIITATFTWATASGALRITGLPYTSAATTNLAPQGAMNFGGITKASYTQFNPQIASNSTNVTVTASGSAQAPSSLAAADLPTGGSVVLRGTVAYHT